MTVEQAATSVHDTGPSTSRFSRGIAGRTRTSLLILAGTVLGTGIALAVTRVMQGLLSGVEPTDIGAFLTAAVSLGVVAFVATLVPAMRAARIHPVEALRSD